MIIPIALRTLSGVLLIFFYTFPEFLLNQEAKYLTLEDSSYNPKSIELTKRAIDLAFPKGVGKPSVDFENMNIALLTIDSAIALDSSYYIAYINKARMLCFYNRPSESIFIIETAVKYCPAWAGGSEVLGLHYESIGDTQSANSQYRLAQKKYHDLFQRKKHLAWLISETEMYLLLNQKSQVDSLLLLMAMKFPDNGDVIKKYEQKVKSFERGKRVKPFCN